MNQDAYERIRNDFTDAHDVPRGDDVYYRCTVCGGMIPSTPDDSVQCKCGNVFIDVDYHRLCVADYRKFEALRRTYRKRKPRTRRSESTGKTAAELTMTLTLASGEVISDPTEEDICEALKSLDFDFAILATSEMTYLQGARPIREQVGYTLTFQEGSTEEHFIAVNRPTDIDKVVAIFLKYLRRDPSWRWDFQWEPMPMP